tara:strand:- start:58 stop:312 length:255 start_codon:yes stop_codon:yes gene_type:complete
MDRIITLQIRHSGDDNVVYLCKTHAIAERIIREWFSEYNNENCIEIHVQQETGRKVPTIKELEDYLWDNDIGYWEITEEVVICE